MWLLKNVFARNPPPDDAKSSAPDERPKMGQSQIKLIYFDSAFYLPLLVPLLALDPVDEGSSIDREDFDQLCRVFREQTHQYDLARIINAIPTTCDSCSLHFAAMGDAASHIFSESHIDEYIKRRGSISSRDFSFWMNLLTLFPKGRKRLPMARLEPLLKDMSIPLDLNSRRKHWTVEVASASEHETALCHFISASMSDLHRVAVSVKDRKEAERVKDLLIKKFPETKPAAIKKRADLCFVEIEEVNGPESKGAVVVFLRPPVAAGKTPSAAFYAFTICSPNTPSSLILINGSEDLTAFRELEKKFMHSRETGFFPIYDVKVLRNLDEVTRVKAEMRSALARSVAAALPPGPTPTVTVPRPDTPARPLTTSPVAPPVNEIPPGVPYKERIPSRHSSGDYSDVKETPSPTVPVEATVFSENTVVNSERSEIDTVDLPTTSWEQAKPIGLRTARKGKRTYGTVKRTNSDEWIDRIPTINETEVTEWPTIFTPFDEETGKAVGEMIRRMSCIDTPNNC